MIQDIAPHIYDVTYKNSSPLDVDIMLIYREGKLLCNMEEEQISYPLVKEISTVFPMVKEKAKFLFCIDGISYFDLPQHRIEEFKRYTYMEKEALREARPLFRAYAGITGFQIHKWYKENQFCGRCGTRMDEHGAERAMKCTSCGKLNYPVICPSVIVGVTDKDRILLTKYQSTHSSFQKYVLVAGYAEVGESLEDTVRREVMEEVGLKVKNIRYYKSQPWSFTDTLLIGYFCEVDGDDKVTIEEEELSEATWFWRGDLPQERSEASISLTGEMMDAFRDSLI